MTAYTRTDESPIYINSAVTEPDVVVVLDPTLLSMVNVFGGLPAGGGLGLVNSTLSAQSVQEEHALQGHTVYTVDANEISMELLHRHLPNLPMMGALLGARRLVSLRRMIKSVQTRLVLRMVLGQGHTRSGGTL